MTNPPIFYAVAQVIFSPVLRMESYVDQIQDAWRGAFPDFSKDSVNEIQLHVPTPGAQPEVRTLSGYRWSFKDVTSTSGYLLTSRSLAIQTTAYKSSVEFIHLLVEGLNAVRTIVVPSYIETVGFRILDGVIPSDGQPLSHYLNPKLLGLNDEIDGDTIQSIYQITKKRASDQLISRTIILDSQIGIPADLAPIQLHFGERFRNVNGLHAVLDNDVIQQERMAFDSIEVARRLRIAKIRLNEAFYQSLTEAALEEWR